MNDDSWIRCCDKLPEPMKWVLVQTVDNEYKIMRKEIGNSYWQSNSKHIFSNSYILCWQPLPKQFSTDTNNTSSLKHCPFCGAEAKIKLILGRDAVCCTGCNATMESDYTPIETMIEMWNRRT